MVWDGRRDKCMKCLSMQLVFGCGSVFVDKLPMTGEQVDWVCEWSGCASLCDMEVDFVLLLSSESLSYWCNKVGGLPSSW